MGTGTSPQGLLDGLALQGLMQISKAALTVWPVLILGTLGLPWDWQLPAWEWELLWPPALAALFLAGYYFAQFLQVWPGNRLLAGAALLAPWLLLPLGVPGALLAAGLSGWFARKLAIRGLTSPQGRRAVPVHKRNPLVRSFSQNPIARREMSRLAGQVGGDWRRLMLWRASMTILPVLWVLWAVSVPYLNWPDTFAGGMLLFCALFFVRSGLRTLPAVVREREQQTWEILMQTHLGIRSFVSGWLQVCLYTVFTEGLLAILALTGYVLAMVPNGDWAWSLPALLLLPAASLLGATVGLAISASSRTARQATQNLMVWSLGGASAWLATLGMVRGFFYRPVYNYGQYEPTLGGISLFCLLPIGLFLAERAWRQLRFLPCIDLDDSQPEERAGSRYSPVVLCLDLSSLALLFCCLQIWKQASPILELSAITGSALLIAGTLVWWLLVRMPLASLCEAALGGRVNLAIGALLGLGLGGSLGQAWKSHPVKLGWQADSMMPFALSLGSVTLGAILGLVASRRRPIDDQRVSTLTRRLRWAVLSVLVSAVLGLGVLSLRLPLPAAPGYTERVPKRGYARQLTELQQRMRLIVRERDLKDQLPELGGAGPEERYQNTHQLRLSLHVLETLAREQRRIGDWNGLLNTFRWCLLCQDYIPDRQVDFSYFREGGGHLNDLGNCLNKVELKGQTAHDLIEQLLYQNPVQNQLRAVYRGHVTPFYNFQERPALPEFYLTRERGALELAEARAEQKIASLDLWNLAYHGDAELLRDVSFCALARRQLNQDSLRSRVREIVREASQREGLALLVAIKLYRQDHDSKWPDNLEAVQSYLPRPARCYTNPEGKFDYKPGLLVGRGDPSGPLILLADGLVK